MGGHVRDFSLQVTGMALLEVGQAVGFEVQWGLAQKFLRP